MSNAAEHFIQILRGPDLEDGMDEDRATNHNIGHIGDTPTINLSSNSNFTLLPSPALSPLVLLNRGGNDATKPNSALAARAQERTQVARAPRGRGCWFARTTHLLQAGGTTDKILTGNGISNRHRRVGDSGAEMLVGGKARLLQSGNEWKQPLHHPTDHRILVIGLVGMVLDQLLGARNKLRDVPE